MDELKRQIRQLSQPQLAELKTYIAGLKSSGPSPSRSRGAVVASWLPLAFTAECQRRGLGFITKATLGLVELRKQAVLDFLAKACPASTVTVQRAVFMVGMGLLYDDMIENGRLTNPRNMAYSLDRLPAVFDRSFPGYAAVGHLALSVTQQARRKFNDGQRERGNEQPSRSRRDSV